MSGNRGNHIKIKLHENPFTPRVPSHNEFAVCVLIIASIVPSVRSVRCFE